MVWRLMRGLIDSFAELVGTASRVKPTTSVPPRLGASWAALRAGLSSAAAISETAVKWRRVKAVN